MSELNQQDRSLDELWSVFCNSSQQNKRNDLYEFLKNLISTTPRNVSLISRLSFSKHQIVSSFVMSQLLLDLERITQNKSSLIREQEEIQQPLDAEYQTKQLNKDKKSFSENLPSSGDVINVELKKDPSPSNTPALVPSIEASLTIDDPFDKASVKQNVADLPDLKLTSSIAMDLQENIIKQDDGSDSSLKVQFSEESDQSSSVSNSSAKVSRKRPSRIGLDVLKLTQDSTFESSDIGSSTEQIRENVDTEKPNEEDLVPSLEKCPSDGSQYDDMPPLESSEDESSVPLVYVKVPFISSETVAPQLEDQEERTICPANQMMTKLIKFLTVGNGSRMLMVLEEIGILGTNIGFELVKLFSAIFEDILDTMIAGETVGNKMKKLKDEKYTSKTLFEPMITKITMEDLFKPIFYPLVPCSLHPTSRVDSYLSETSRNKVNGHSNRKHSSKRIKQRLQVVKPVEDSDEDLESKKQRKKQYLKYKSSQSICECFHFLSNDDSSNEDEPRSLILSKNAMLKSILSLIMQVSLFDPFNKPCDYYSNECSKFVFEFGLETLHKICLNIQSIGFPLHWENIIENYVPCLVKVLFAGCHHFARSFQLSKQFINLEVPKKLNHLCTVLKDLYCNFNEYNLDVDKEKFQIWIGTTLGDLVIGQLMIIKAISCDRQCLSRYDKKNCPIKSFLGNDQKVLLEQLMYVIIITDSPNIHQLVSNLSNTIVYLKFWKEDLFNTQKSNKLQHKNYDLHSISYHHSSHYGDRNNACMIATLVQCSLLVVRECSDCMFGIKTLNLLSKCGVCCCIKSNSILPYLIQVLHLKSIDLQYTIFSFIENTLLSELNGKRSLNTVVDCIDCIHAENDEVTYEQFYTPESSTILVQWNYQTPSSNGRWSGLNDYPQYILSASDTDSPSSVAQHLIRLLEISRNKLGREIAHRVLIPILNKLNVSEDYFDLKIINDIFVSLRVCFELTFGTFIFQIMRRLSFSFIKKYKDFPETGRNSISLLLCIIDSEWRSSAVGMFSESRERELQFYKTFEEMFLEEAKFIDYFRKKSFYFCMKNCDSVEEEFNLDDIPSYVTSQFIQDAQNLDSEKQVLMFERAADFWSCVSEFALKSSSFRAFVLNSDLREMVVTFLSNIGREYSRLSKDMNQSMSVIYKSQDTTISLCSSLLTCVIVCYSDGVSNPPLAEFRQQLNQIEPKTCSEFRSLVTMLIKCSVSVDEEVNKTSKLDTMLSESVIPRVIGEDSSSSVTSEDYDADVENIEGLNIKKTDSCASLIPCTKNQQPRLQCPILLIIAIELLTKHHQKVLENLNELECDKVPESQLENFVLKETIHKEEHCTSVCRILQNILAICKGSKDSCLKLQKLGFLTKLIAGLGDQISIVDEIDKDVLTVVAEIWAEIAQYSLSAEELTQYFGLIQSSSLHVSILLRPLKKVLENSKEGREPHYYLQFPCSLKATSELHENLAKSPVSLSSFVYVQTPTSPALEAIANTRNNHIDHEIVSVLSLSALVIPLGRVIDWSLYSTGTSVATCLNVKKKNCFQDNKTTSYATMKQYTTFPKQTMAESSPKKDLPLYVREFQTRLHILSVGSQQLMFSFWIEPHSDKLYVSASSETDIETTLIHETCIENVGLRGTGWHHFAAVIFKRSIKDYTVPIAIIIDGVSLFQTKIRIGTVGKIDKSTSLFLTIGQVDLSTINDIKSGSVHCVPSYCDAIDKVCYNLSMGCIYLFKEPNLTREMCLGLIALGRNATNLLIGIPNSQKVLFPPLINSRLLTAHMDLSVLYNDMNKLIEPLKQSLHVQYLPERQNCFSLYKRSDHIAHCDFGPIYSSVTNMDAAVYGDLNLVTKATPDLALLHIGGASQLVFLCAKVAELESSERDLADAISLLIKICRLEPTVSLQMAVFNGPELICRLMKAPLAPAGVLVLKTLLESCMSPSVIRFDAARNQFAFSTQSDPILVDRGLLEILLINYRCFTEKKVYQSTYTCIFQSCENNVLTPVEMVFSAIACLLSNTNPYKHFNLVQLRDINAIYKIMSIIEDMKAERTMIDQIHDTDLIGKVISSLLFCPEEPKENSTQGEINVSKIGLSYPSLRGDELKQVGHFMLFLQPDEYSFISTREENAFYLAHKPFIHNSRPTSKNIDMITTKFSKCTLLPDSDVKSIDHLDDFENLILDNQNKELVDTTYPFNQDCSVEQIEMKELSVSPAKEEQELSESPADEEQLPESPVDEELSQSPAKDELTESSENTKPLSSATCLFDTLGELCSCPNCTYLAKIGEIIIAILDNIVDIIQSLPLIKSRYIIGEMFNIQTLLVLANNPHSRVRASVLGLFKTMIFKGTKETSDLTTRRKLLLLMSHQLHKHYSTSEDLVAEAFSLALFLQHKETDLVLEDILMKADHCPTLFIPLFAILPNTVCNIPLCHNTLTVFLQLLKKNESQILRIYCKAWMLESLLLTIRNCTHDSSNNADNSSVDIDSYLIIIDDVTEIICFVVSTLLSFPLEAAYKAGVDALNQISLFARKEAASCNNMCCIEALTDVEAAVLEVSLLRLSMAALPFDKPSGNTNQKKLDETFRL